MSQRSRPQLVVIASKGWRHDPAGPLQSLARDYADALKKFQIHATGGTARTLLATSDDISYALSDTLQASLSAVAQDAYLPLSPTHSRRRLEDDADLIVHRYGSEGGLVEVAAAVAGGQCVAVLLLLDPSDNLSELPENRALQRICKDLGVRLISNLHSARQWAEDEASTYAHKIRPPKIGSRPNYLNRIQGHSNVNEGLYVELERTHQTIAIIAHDGKKFEMLKFVRNHSALLSQYQRILTTGTTGHTIRLVFAGAHRSAWAPVLTEAQSDLASPKRMLDLILTAGRFLIEIEMSTRNLELIEAWRDHSGLEHSNLTEELDSQLAKWRSVLSGDKHASDATSTSSTITPMPHLIAKVLPAPSGPRGGDILLANEVLQHRCHVALFFQDPAQSHAHDTDIRLFDRTCHFWSDRQPAHRVYITCVSDETSAAQWAISKTATRRSLTPPEELIRRKYGVEDVVIVRECTDTEDDKNGALLAREGARYLVNTLYSNYKRSIFSRIVVGQGQVMHELAQCVLREVAEPERIAPPHSTEWLPATGLIPYAFPLRQASSIAMRLADRFGGASSAFRSTFFTDKRDEELTRPDVEIIEAINSANTFVLVVGPWDSSAVRELRSEDVDRVVAKTAVTMMGAALIDGSGKEVIPTRGALVGMSYERFSTACADPNCRVIVMCGSERRLTGLRAILENSPRWRSIVLIISDPIAKALAKSSSSTASSS